MIVLVSLADEVEPKLAAALISTAILLAALLFARGAREESLRKSQPSGSSGNAEGGRQVAHTVSTPAIVGRFGLSALFLFGFLCTRGVEILYLLGPDAPLNAESFSETYFALSAAHCGLAVVGVIWLVLVLSRTARRGVKPRPSKFMNGAVRFLYFVTGTWLLLVVTYYLF